MEISAEVSSNKSEEKSEQENSFGTLVRTTSNSY